ncbi:hypothetical protein VN97_g7231 [Penicillium thymicola]|uniref:Uncharacterized protein n=1 Tax=Penicillium thymicola TaxID=293382 RepID=A0AAI9X6W5_PENTH|nr:hypothetical protein VN97_g7231 [Penicillium thymicola]
MNQVFKYPSVDLNTFPKRRSRLDLSNGPSWARTSGPWPNQQWAMGPTFEAQLSPWPIGGGPKPSPFASWAGLGCGLYGPVRRSNQDKADKTSSSSMQPTCLRPL